MWPAHQQPGKFALTLKSDLLITYTDHMQLKIFNELVAKIFNGIVAMIGNGLPNGWGKGVKQTPTYHVVQLYAQSI